MYTEKPANKLKWNRVDVTSLKLVLEEERQGSWKTTEKSVHCREIERAFARNKENVKDKVSFNFIGWL